MPSLSIPYAALGAAAHGGLFGGNILAPRASMTGEGSYAEAVEALGVTTLRYPGGSLTEDYFDLRDPDATLVIDPDTGLEETFIPLSEVMAYSAESGRPVTIVLPTRDQLSDTMLDNNGDRLPAIDREVLTEFLRDLVEGEYGDGEVAAVEIGNEYWGSGQMNAAEYGRLASDMAQIIDRTLADLAQTHPGAAEIDILVQVGTNFGSSDLEATYEGVPETEVIADINATHGITLPDTVLFPNGGLDWTEINNEILISQFDAEGLQATDGVIAHLYSRAPVVEHSRWFQLEQIEQSWLSRDPELEIHVTEWNQKANTAAFEDTEDYGLYQAQEMLEQVEEFMRLDVEAAQVWPLIQNTPSALALGREFDETTVPGEMFAMMSENLPGMTMLDFSPGEGRDTEFETPEMDVHAFGDGRDLLFYFTSNLRDGVVQSEVDISNLVDGFDGIEITTLGVARGAAPGDNTSPPVLEQPDPDDLYVSGLLETVLAPGEIMQVRLTDVVPTSDFAPAFAETGSEAAPQVAAAEIPDGAELMAALGNGAEVDRAPGDEDDDEDIEVEDSDGSDLGGLSWALGLLPLLFFLG